jgi:pyridoxamine 5'-phosphate oxidase
MSEDAVRRQDYQRGHLTKADVDPDPIAQVRRWLADAVEADEPEPYAMTLATADADGIPSARTVLLRRLDARGFTFFTNQTSRKATELEVNPHAALVLVWLDLERQVCVAGTVARVPDGESDDYFASRPLGSQLGAWASEQSTVIPNRDALEAAHAAVASRFADGEVPRPPWWGGYRLTPTRVEVWQGRRDRLHDRLQYRRDGDAWELERLSP